MCEPRTTRAVKYERINRISLNALIVLLIKLRLHSENSTSWVLSRGPWNISGCPKSKNYKFGIHNDISVVLEEN